MPFVKKIFHTDTPVPAFIYIMKTLGISQAQAQRFIHLGKLCVNKEVITDTAKKICGDIELELFEPVDLGIKPIFQTKDFLIFDKPSNMLVHPKTRQTPKSMLDCIRFYGGNEANSTHRIDKETSGLLLASKHKSSEIYLKGAFEKRVIHKSYLAWVEGKIDTPFSVNMPIKKRDNYDTNKHKVEISTLGKPSYTDFIPIKYDEELDATLIECYPKTGRMHQIRIHLFHVKHPILGDPLYGRTFDISNKYLDGKLDDSERMVHTGASRLMLHAQSLEFEYEGIRYKIKSLVNFKELKNMITPKEQRKQTTKN
ncbi:MAG: pseudouridine synthase [Sulfurovum sp. AS07-7]|nr:MAG: pseudouridine synthase [Sulfurovum sp. AS07-7]